MKIGLDDLKKGLELVYPAVAKRATLPILNHVMLKAGGDEIQLTANNLEIAIETRVGAMIEEEAEITVPAKLFADYLKALGGGEVELTADEKTATLTVETEDNEGSVKGMSPKDFPVIPVVEGETIEFAPADLLEAIDMVAFAAGDDETRIVLTGILINLVGQKLKMTTADGFRLSKYERVVAGCEANCRLLVPAKAFGALAQIARQHPEDAIKMKVGEERLAFKVGSTTLTCGLISGHFPDVGKIIPDEDKATTTMVVDRKDFLNTVKTTNVIAKYDSELIILEITQGAVSASGQAAELGDNTGECNAEVEGDDLKIAFRAKYLIEALSAIKDETVKFYFTAPSAPAMIKREGFTHIIMPMALTQ